MWHELQNIISNVLGVSPEAATFIICVPALIFAIYLMKKYIVLEEYAWHQSLL